MGHIEQDIERFLRTGEGPFDSLVLELFRYQYERNKPYQSYCRSLNLGAADVRRWQDIPAVPVGAFKSAELATFPVGQAAAVFESSGTTVRTPSRHYLKTLAYYETSLKTSFEKWMLQNSMSKMPFLILTPSPAEAPRSSLSWMMDVVKRTWGAPGSQYFVRHGRLDELWLSTLLTKAQVTGSPALLLGTTIAYLALFDYCVRSGKRFHLPAGSRLMDTGGMKTEKREITRPEFVQRAEEFLGIPEDDCVNEYGMCEMSSQFYGRGPSTLLEGPPWVRTLVFDPATGQEVPDGQPGLLRHIDLANVDSVLAIQTEDLGYRVTNGFVLLGRAPQADLKGCSVSAEAFLR
jgi:hypothetical protein